MDSHLLFFIDAFEIIGILVSSPPAALFFFCQFCERGWDDGLKELVCAVFGLSQNPSELF
jgi:hypothetical protein